MTTHSRKEWMTFYRKNLYNFAKMHEKMGEDIHVTSRFTKSQIVDAIFEYFDKKSLSEPRPEMSVRVQRIWEASQNQEK